jgi:hypothetical protein
MELWNFIFDVIERLVNAWVESEKPIPITTGPPIEEPDPPKPEPELPRETVPREGPKPQLYVQWDRREAWANKIEQAYTVWRGDRDLGYMQGFPEIMDEFGIDREQLNIELAEMRMVDVLGKQLAHRVRTQVHRKFRDRSQVRKSKVNEMVSALYAQTQVYNKYRAKFPRGPEYDSIQGYINFRLGIRLS